jgi:hypothetical protein
MAKTKNPEVPRENTTNAETHPNPTKTRLDAARKTTNDQIAATAGQEMQKKPEGKENKEGKNDQKPEAQNKKPADQKPEEPDSAPTPPPAPEPKKPGFIKRSWNWVKSWSKPIAGVGAISAAGAAVAAGGTGIESLPILGKIPYLPEAAAWLQHSFFGAANYLGLNTGALATKAYLATLPSWLGPAAIGAITIPAAIWGIGKIKQALYQMVNDTQFPGFLQPVKEALKTPIQIAAMPFKLFQASMRGIGSTARGTAKFSKNAITGTANFLFKKPYESIVKPLANIAGQALKPTGWGVGGAVAGGLLAAGSGAGALGIVTVPVLYGIMNYLKNSGKLGGGGAAPSAPAASHG